MFACIKYEIFSKALVVESESCNTYEIFKHLLIHLLLTARGTNVKLLRYRRRMQNKFLIYKYILII